MVQRPPIIHSNHRSENPQVGKSGKREAGSGKREGSSGKGVAGGEQREGSSGKTECESQLKRLAARSPLLSPINPTLLPRCSPLPSPPTLLPRCSPLPSPPTLLPRCSPLPSPPTLLPRCSPLPSPPTHLPSSHASRALATQAAFHARATTRVGGGLSADAQRRQSLANRSGGGLLRGGAGDCSRPSHGGRQDCARRPGTRRVDCTTHVGGAVGQTEGRRLSAGRTRADQRLRLPPRLRVPTTVGACGWTRTTGDRHGAAGTAGRRGGDSGVGSPVQLQCSHRCRDGHLRVLQAVPSRVSLPARGFSLDSPLGSHHVASHHVASHHVASCHVSSHHIASCRAVSSRSDPHPSDSVVAERTRWLVRSRAVESMGAGAL